MEDYDLKIKFTKDELPTRTLNKNPIIKIYGNNKFSMGMFYGYMLGSFLTFIVMVILINL